MAGEDADPKKKKSAPYIRHILKRLPVPLSDLSDYHKAVESHLQGMMLTFAPWMGGVALKFNNVVCGDDATMEESSGRYSLPVEARFTVLSPKEGDLMAARVVKRMGDGSLIGVSSFSDRVSVRISVSRENPKAEEAGNVQLGDQVLFKFTKMMAKKKVVFLFGEYFKLRKKGTRGKEEAEELNTMWMSMQQIGVDDMGDGEIPLSRRETRVTPAEIPFSQQETQAAPLEVLKNVEIEREKVPETFDDFSVVPSSQPVKPSKSERRLVKSSRKDSAISSPALRVEQQNGTLSSDSEVTKCSRKSSKSSGGDSGIKSGQKKEEKERNVDPTILGSPRLRKSSKNHASSPKVEQLVESPVRPCSVTLERLTPTKSTEKEDKKREKTPHSPGRRKKKVEDSESEEEPVKKPPQASRNLKNIWAISKAISSDSDEEEDEVGQVSQSKSLEMPGKKVESEKRRSPVKSPAVRRASQEESSDSDDSGSEKPVKKIEKSKSSWTSRKEPSESESDEDEVAKKPEETETSRKTAKSVASSGEESQNEVRKAQERAKSAGKYSSSESSSSDSEEELPVKKSSHARSDLTKQLLKLMESTSEEESEEEEVKLKPAGKTASPSRKGTLFQPMMSPEETESSRKAAKSVPSSGEESQNEVKKAQEQAKSAGKYSSSESSSSESEEELPVKKSFHAKSDKTKLPLKLVESSSEEESEEEVKLKPAGKTASPSTKGTPFNPMMSSDDEEKEAEKEKKIVEDPEVKEKPSEDTSSSEDDEEEQLGKSTAKEVPEKEKLSSERSLDEGSEEEGQKHFENQVKDKQKMPPPLLPEATKLALSDDKVKEARVRSSPLSQLGMMDDWDPFPDTRHLNQQTELSLDQESSPLSQLFRKFKKPVSSSSDSESDNEQPLRRPLARPLAAGGSLHFPRKRALLPTRRPTISPASSRAVSPSVGRLVTPGVSPVLSRASPKPSPLASTGKSQEKGKEVMVDWKIKNPQKSKPGEETDSESWEKIDLNEEAESSGIDDEAVKFAEKKAVMAKKLTDAKNSVKTSAEITSAALKHLEESSTSDDDDEEEEEEDAVDASTKPGPVTPKPPLAKPSPSPDSSPNLPPVTPKQPPSKTTHAPENQATCSPAIEQLIARIRATAAGLDPSAAFLEISKVVRQAGSEVVASPRVEEKKAKEDRNPSSVEDEDEESPTETERVKLKAQRKKRLVDDVEKNPQKAAEKPVEQEENNVVDQRKKKKKRKLDESRQENSFGEDESNSGQKKKRKLEELHEELPDEETISTPKQKKKNRKSELDAFVDSQKKHFEEIEQTPLVQEETGNSERKKKKKKKPEEQLNESVLLVEEVTSSQKKKKAELIELEEEDTPEVEHFSSEKKKRKKDRKSQEMPEEDTFTFTEEKKLSKKKKSIQESEQQDNTVSSFDLSYQKARDVLSGTSVEKKRRKKSTGELESRKSAEEPDETHKKLKKKKRKEPAETFSVHSCAFEQERKNDGKNEKRDSKTIEYAQGPGEIAAEFEEKEEQDEIRAKVAEWLGREPEDPLTKKRTEPFFKPLPRPEPPKPKMEPIRVSDDDSGSESGESVDLKSSVKKKPLLLKMPKKRQRSWSTLSGKSDDVTPLEEEVGLLIQSLLSDDSSDDEQPGKAEVKSRTVTPVSSPKVASTSISRKPDKKRKRSSTREEEIHPEDSISASTAKKRKIDTDVTEYEEKKPQKKRKSVAFASPLVAPSPEPEPQPETIPEDVHFHVGSSKKKKKRKSKSQED